jgi:hypothetical protein
MIAMTNEQTREYVNKYSWSSGLKASDYALYYDDPNANAIFLKFPETPLRATYFARVASMLGIEDESLFYGALLWITLSDIGSPQIEKSGWVMAEMMRRSFGENRPLGLAPGHHFRNGAVVELTAFVLLCFVFAWDAYIIPQGLPNDDYFVHISHDEYWAVITRNDVSHAQIMKALGDLEPVESHQRLLRQFCRSSKHLRPE